MNAYRKMMMDCGENLGWCKPYISDDGKNAIAVIEGEVCGMIIDGVNMDLDLDVTRFARTVNPDYDLYSGWSDLHIAIDGDVTERPCCECPWFDICEAMDNPMDWESGEYKDD